MSLVDRLQIIDLFEGSEIVWYKIERALCWTRLSLFRIFWKTVRWTRPNFMTAACVDMELAEREAGFDILS